MVFFSLFVEGSKPVQGRRWRSDKYNSECGRNELQQAAQGSVWFFAFFIWIGYGYTRLIAKDSGTWMYVFQDQID